MPATNWFRKNQKKLLGILVVFLMVIWGIGPAVDLLVPKPPIGEIFGEKVSQEEFNDTVVRWARVFFRDSREPVAEQVWKQMALFRQADEMGILVTNEELAQETQNWFPFDPQIFAGKEEYRRMLGSIFHMTEYQFEKTFREYLLAQKLMFFLKNSVKITKDEAFQRYMKENEEVKVKYAAFKAKDFINHVEANEDEIRSFYDKYSGNFPNPEEGIWGYKEPEKVKIEYVMARYDVLEEVNITDEEMHKYYEDNKDVIFNEDVYKEAIDVFKGTEKSEEEKPDKTSIPEYKPFDEVKERIKNTLRREKNEELANKRIGKADKYINDNIGKEIFISFPKLAAKNNLLYIVPTNPGDGTNYFRKDELRKVIIGMEQLPQLVSERDVNDPSPPLGSLEGKLIFQVLERLEPSSPPYEEIRDRVEEDLRYSKAFKKAETFAEKCIDKIKQTSFQEGVKSIQEETGKIEIVETDYFSRPGIISENDYIKVLGSDRPNLAEMAFDLKIGESAVAIEGKGEKTCYVITLVDRKKVDPEKFEAERDAIMKGYLIEKQLAFLSEWESWVNKKTRLGKGKS
ncbi:MAG: SurA N-terminal domain-containing protein [Candidatus Scalinduaceae bacterium]